MMVFESVYLLVWVCGCGGGWVGGCACARVRAGVCVRVCMCVCVRTEPADIILGLVKHARVNVLREALRGDGVRERVPV